MINIPYPYILQKPIIYLENNICDKSLGMNFRGLVYYNPQYVSDVHTISISQIHVVFAEIDSNTEYDYYTEEYEEIETELNSKLISISIPRSFSNTNLEYGKQYSISISIKETNNSVWSIFSDPVLFYCLSNPYFQIANLENGSIINSSSKNMIVSYHQSEGEQLNTFRFELYDENNKLVEKTNDISYSSQDNYTFNNLENEKQYSIILYGRTVNGCNLVCEPVSFLIDYVSLKQSPILIAKNNKENGYIELKTNIISFECKFFDDEKKDFENGKLNIYEDNYLDYFNGLNITYNEDFSMFIKFDILDLGKILSFNYDEVVLSITEIFGIKYCELKTNNTVIYKEMNDSETVVINLIRKNGIFDFAII